MSTSVQAHCGRVVRYDEDEYIDPVQLGTRSATPLASLNDPTEGRSLAEVQAEPTQEDHANNDDNDDNDDASVTSTQSMVIRGFDSRSDADGDDNDDNNDNDPDVFNEDHRTSDTELVTRLERRRSSFQAHGSVSEDNTYDSGTDEDRDQEEEPALYCSLPDAESLADESPVPASLEKASAWGAILRKTPNPAAQALMAVQQGSGVALPADRFAVMRRASIVAHLTQHGRRRSAAAR